MSGRDGRLAVIAGLETGQHAGMDLTEAVQALRAQLNEAVRQGAGDEIAFELGDVELEFQVELTTTVRSGGQARFVVVSADTNRSRVHAQTHTVRLTLKPRASGGGSVVIVDEDEDVPDR